MRQETEPLHLLLRFLYVHIVSGKSLNFSDPFLDYFNELEGERFLHYYWDDKRERDEGALLL